MNNCENQKSDGSDRFVRSSVPPKTPPPQKMLRPRGGYRNLRSFQVSEIVYDATVAFCDRFIDKRCRTHDQMVQAARSRRQNIAEGSRAAGTSSQTELRLVGVARASLDELLLDYEDFLRQRRLPIWSKDDPRAKNIRAIGLSPASAPVPPIRNHPTDLSDPTHHLSDPTHPTDPSDHPSHHPDQSLTTHYAPYRAFIETAEPETAANTVICLIHQANYLLDRQLQVLEQQFIQGGGYTEQLADARRKERARQWSGRPVTPNLSDQTDPSDLSASPTCPKCNLPMILRTARKGSRAGSQFWGCPSYPDCSCTTPFQQPT